MEEIYLALKIGDKDNVATVFANGVCDGTQIRVMDKRGLTETIKVREHIPYGHKIALCNIHQGEVIDKYNEVIGMASCEIAKGDYVHAALWILSWNS